MTLPSSPAIVGRAVARIVWSSTAGNIAATMAANGSATALASGVLGRLSCVVSEVEAMSILFPLCCHSKLLVTVP